MSKLTDLIAAYRKAYASAEQGADYVDEAYALAEYVVAHADDIIERERLDRAVVEAWHTMLNEEAKQDIIHMDEVKTAYHELVAKLIRFIITHAHAETENT